MIVDINNLNKRIKKNLDAIPEQYKAFFLKVLFVYLFLYAIYIFYSAITNMPEL